MEQTNGAFWWIKAWTWKDDGGGGGGDGGGDGGGGGGGSGGKFHMVQI